MSYKTFTRPFQFKKFILFDSCGNFSRDSIYLYIIISIANRYTSYNFLYPKIHDRYYYICADCGCFVYYTQFQYCLDKRKKKKQRVLYLYNFCPTIQHYNTRWTAHIIYEIYFEKLKGKSKSRFILF